MPGSVRKPDNLVLERWTIPGGNTFYDPTVQGRSFQIFLYNFTAHFIGVTDKTRNLRHCYLIGKKRKRRGFRVRLLFCKLGKIDT